MLEEIGAVAFRRPIRRMRGGAESLLIEGGDDRHYVVKFKNNPQGQTILVNEILAAPLARCLGLPAAGAAVVELSTQDACGLSIRTPFGETPVEAGLHFGSRAPVDPTRVAIYDYFPDKLLEKVGNLSAGIGVWLFDVWTGNLDSRQVVYSPNPRGSRERGRYRLTMIDNGWCFGGPNWKFRDLERPLLPWQRKGMQMGNADAFEVYASAIRSFDATRLRAFASCVPDAWLESPGLRQRFEEMLEALAERSQKIEQLVERSVAKADRGLLLGRTARSAASLPAIPSRRSAAPSSSLQPLSA